MPANQLSATFCSFIWPRHPGYTGGEIRDYHLLRGLMACAQVRFLSLTRPDPNDEREDALQTGLLDFSSPQDLPAHMQVKGLKNRLGRFTDRLHGWMYRRGLPYPFSSYHAEVAGFAYQTRAFLLPVLQAQLKNSAPDFLFVSPQHNPILSQLKHVPGKTRTILASYDVESVRVERLVQENRGMARLTGRLETWQSRRYERGSLSRYDGLIAVSALDRDIFVEKYRFDSERILVLENSVDADYFAFHARSADAVAASDVVFVANLAYEPNAEAARRLLKTIMPRVRVVFPQSRCWVVGQQPPQDLLEMSDSKNVVTGRVDDVRPYMERAAVACVPLSSGSGTKFKVLEAASAGLPVVCTSIALEGLRFTPDKHLLLADDDESLAQAVISVLKNPAKYETMVASARQQAEENYSWNVALENLAPWLDAVRQMPLRRSVR